MTTNPFHNANMLMAEIVQLPSTLHEKNNQLKQRKKQLNAIMLSNFHYVAYYSLHTTNYRARADGSCCSVNILAHIATLY